jgi:NTP pyrophosphatase (non-canonical NTP hydrolase)
MERDRQIKLWGDGPLPYTVRLSVLVEEVGEVAKAMQDETDKELLAELSQVAAVLLRWMEDLLLEMDR